MAQRGGASQAGAAPLPFPREPERPRLASDPADSTGPEGGQLLSVSAAAVRFQLPRATIYDWLARGRLPLHREGGRARVAVQELLDLLSLG
jgi:excisionase family DNA binding protein